MSTTKIVPLDTSISTTYPPNHRGVQSGRIIDILTSDRISTALIHTLSDLILALLIKIDETSIEIKISPTTIFYDSDIFHIFQKNIKDTCRPHMYKYQQDGGSIS